MSDELVTGPDTGGWGSPAGVFNYCTGQMVFGGMVWFGEDPPTAQDFQNLVSEFGEHVMVDIPTLFGAPAHFYRVQGTECYTAPTVTFD